MEKINSYSAFYGKNVLIGVSGSIAAYKIPDLVRLFKKEGANVKLILTKDAANFVTPLTLSTLSSNKVFIDFTNDLNNQWNNHVELALWADVFLIAPATANTISKMAHGLCDNILLATFLSSKCQVFCAPAMDRDMYLHRSTVKNLQILKKRGVYILDVESGELASGLHGLGRMRDITKLINELEGFFLKDLLFYGKRILITAGPTYEKIDPVRFIGNFSSGKMGCELAKFAANQGAIVDLIIGPSYELVDHPLVNRVNIETAHQMFTIVKEKFKYSDVAIFSAAVSDFKPLRFKRKKIKRKSLQINVEPNVDVLKTISSTKKDQFIVGFALETDNEDANAIKKMQEKNMDLVILNSLNDKEACFGYDTNKVKIIDHDLNIKTYPLMTKKELASVILSEVFYRTKNASINSILK